MEWLTPTSALIAGAITVPLLLLMYFLKLRRQERFISSTILWKRAVQDLQVNAPLQRIRRNLLLLLQILMLLAILLALAEPVLSLVNGAAGRYVILIDHSASMNSKDAGKEKNKPRLEVARKQASEFVKSLRSRAKFSLNDNSDQAMVIAFNEHSQVMCNFTSDKQQLLQAIEAIAPGDGGSDPAEAIQVAQAFAQPAGVETNNRSSEQTASLILFSDGRIANTRDLAVGGGEISFYKIGQVGNNIALTTLQSRRPYENPDDVEVFATIANYYDQQINTDIQLSLNGNVRAIKSVTLPAGTITQGDANSPEGTIAPGKLSVDFTLPQAQAGLLELRLLHKDALRDDDAAWNVLPGARRLSVLLVSTGNAVLESAIKACSLARLEVKTPEQFEKLAPSFFSKTDGSAQYDVIILDRYVPSNPPSGRYLVFGKVPDGISVKIKGELTNQVVVDWRNRHPVMKYVNPQNIFVLKGLAIAPPRDAEIIAEFSQSPAITLVNRQKRVFLMVSFDVLESNWPFQPGFIVFCYNAISFLGRQAGSDPVHCLKADEPLTLTGLKTGTTVEISYAGPAENKAKILEKHFPVNSAGEIRYANTSRVGVYEIKIKSTTTEENSQSDTTGGNDDIKQGPGRQLFAVNMLDEQESNIAPVGELVLAGQAIPERTDLHQYRNVALWPWLVVAALIFTYIEWWVYSGKVRI